MTDSLIATFDPENPAASVPELLAVRSQLAAFETSRLVEEKRRQLDQILEACLGLTVETTVAHAEVVPGEAMALHHAATVCSDVPVKWLSVRYPSISKEVREDIDLHPAQTAQREATQTIPSNAPLSQPYWLREPPGIGTYHVADLTLVGRPENPPAFPVEQIFEVGGQKLVIPDEPIEVIANPNKQLVRRRLEIVAPVALSFDYDIENFVPGVERQVQVQVEAIRAPIAGQLKLETPDDWKVKPESQTFQIAEVGQNAKLSFAVTPPPKATSAEIIARAEINGSTFDNRRVEIHYDHIPPLLLQPAAHLKAIALDLAIRGHRVGYVSGDG